MQKEDKLGNKILSFIGNLLIRGTIVAVLVTILSALLAAIIEAISTQTIPVEDQMTYILIYYIISLGGDIFGIWWIIKGTFKKSTLSKQNINKFKFVVVGIWLLLTMMIFVSNQETGVIDYVEQFIIFGVEVFALNFFINRETIKKKESISE